MLLEWYHWAIFGLVVLAFELAVPVFVLVWFGLGALIVALAIVFLPFMSIISQLILWASASVLFVLLWFKVFKPSFHKIRSGRSSAEALGEIGLLVEELAPFGKARVRFQTPLLGSDVWECVGDEKIPAGSRVKVISVEGNLLKITKA